MDFAVYQYRRGPERDAPWAWFYQETLGQRATLPGKPFLAAEYDNLHGGRLARERGLAAVFAGAAGVGNGAPAGLAAFFETLPDGVQPAREGDALLLSAPGVRARARPGALHFGCEGCGAPGP